MSHQMYRVSVVDREGSPWELLAKSPEHAIMTVRKFYPQTANLKLTAVELTLLGDPIHLLHQLSYGEKFQTIIPTNYGKPAIPGPTYIKCDFNPTNNQYLCKRVNGYNSEYFDPYTKIIKLED